MDAWWYYPGIDIGISYPPFLSDQPSTHTYRPNCVRSEVLIAVLLRIWVSWDMTLWCWVSGSWLLKDPRLECLTTEDEDAMILWNVRNHSPSDAVLHSRRLIPCKYNCWNKDHLKWTLKRNYVFISGATRWHSWLRHCATSREVAGSIPDGVIGIFHWHNLSGCTMTLGSTQPLTEMSTRNIFWG